MNRTSSLYLMALLALLMMATSSCSNRKTKVKKYVDAINFEHQLVINRLDALDRSLESYIPANMDKAYQRAFDQLDSSEIIIRSFNELQGDDDLRDDALILFDTYRLLLKDEYSEIITRQKKPAGMFTVVDEFLVINLGKHIHNNRIKAKEKFEREAAAVLQKYDVPFTSVSSEGDELSSSKRQDSTAQER